MEVTTKQDWDDSKRTFFCSSNNFLISTAKIHVYSMDEFESILSVLNVPYNGLH